MAVFQKIKEENEKLLKEYGFCVMDNHRERIANFKIEPPGLFRGRGNHPKMGMLKRRIMPEDIIINMWPTFLAKGTDFYTSALKAGGEGDGRG